ncbi:MAG: DUF6458 family protein [Candidatus Lutibacillus vidarii]|jgi:hypothetical protein|nr:hypothetical protein [Candidatus Lutibacillus vidarii]
MHIGSGVFLLVLGAILNWGVADRVSGVNLHVIGLICMAGGVLAILLSLVTGSRSRGYSATRTATVDKATGTTVERVDVES